MHSVTLAAFEDELEKIAALNLPVNAKLFEGIAAKAAKRGWGAERAAQSANRLTYASTPVARRINMKAAIAAKPKVGPSTAVGRAASAPPKITPQLPQTGGGTGVGFAPMPLARVADF